jgi:hypothetical protein
VPVKGVMAMFGLELANLLNTSKVPGIDTDKNDLIVDLAAMLPPPHLRGKISGIRVEADRIVTLFGDGGPALEANRTKGNYIQFHGNNVRFGKLTMEKSDLLLVDMDPKDPLDWYQDHYQEQLEAGYSKITKDFGLVSYVRDYSKLTKSRNPSKDMR